MANLFSDGVSMSLRLGAWLIVVSYGCNATSINTYLSCSLQYYLSQVLHLEVNNNDATGMGVYSADMGSAIHEVLKTEAEKYHFAVSYSKQAIKEKILQAYLNLKGKNYQAQDFTSGVNSLLLEVAVEYVDKYLKYAKEKYAGAHITSLLDAFYGNENVKENISRVQQDLLNGKISPYQAGTKVLDDYFKHKED